MKKRNIALYVLIIGILFQPISSFCETEKFTNFDAYLTYDMDGDEIITTYHYNENTTKVHIFKNEKLFSRSMIDKRLQEMRIEYFSGQGGEEIETEFEGWKMISKNFPLSNITVPAYAKEYVRNKPVDAIVLREQPKKTSLKESRALNPSGYEFLESGSYSWPFFSDAVFQYSISKKSVEDEIMMPGEIPDNNRTVFESIISGFFKSAIGAVVVAVVLESPIGTKELIIGYLVEYLGEQLVSIPFSLNVYKCTGSQYRIQLGGKLTKGPWIETTPYYDIIRIQVVYPVFDENQNAIPGKTQIGWVDVPYGPEIFRKEDCLFDAALYYYAIHQHKTKFACDRKCLDCEVTLTKNNHAYINDCKVCYYCRVEDPKRSHVLSPWKLVGAQRGVKDSKERQVCSNPKCNYVKPDRNHNFVSYPETTVECGKPVYTRFECNNNTLDGTGQPYYYNWPCGAYYAETITRQHKWSTSMVITKAPTCNGTGEKRYPCMYANCETYSTAMEIIPALGHQWNPSTIIKSATCWETGSQQYVCARDPNHTETRTTDKLEHDWRYETKEKTCTQDGYSRKVCNRCGDTVYTHIDASFGHQYGAYQNTGSSVSHTAYCVYNCGATKSEVHSYGYWTMGNTTSHTRQCNICNYPASETHKWVQVSSTYTYCSSCGRVK